VVGWKVAGLRNDEESKMKLAEHLFITIIGDVADERKTFHTLLDACHKANARVCGTSKHEFYPRGFSAIVLISESHASVHTWPESNVALVDFFTCANPTGFDNFIEAWEDAGYTIATKEVLNR